MESCWTLPWKYLVSFFGTSFNVSVKGRWFLPLKVVYFYCSIQNPFLPLGKIRLTLCWKAVEPSQGKLSNLTVKNRWILSWKVFGTSRRELSIEPSRWKSFFMFFFNFSYKCLMLPWKTLNNLGRSRCTLSWEVAGPSREKSLNLAVESCWTFPLKVVFFYIFISFFLFFSYFSNESRCIVLEKAAETFRGSR